MARTAKTTETKTTKTPKKTAAVKAPKEVKDKAVKPKPKFKTYNVFFGGKDMETHPAGKQPKQAARKAITPIFKSMLDAKKDPKKVAAIEKFLDKNKKDKNGQPKKTEKYKTEMNKYEEELSKDFMDKRFVFYLIQKSPKIKREYRHYYYGVRQSINPDVNSYLTKVDPKDKSKKITIAEKDFNGKLIKDKDGRVIEIQIPHYEMRPILDKDGKPMLDEKGKKKMERIPGKEPRIISYKYTNVVAKLTREFYDAHKAEFGLTPEQEQELMDHFDHKRPKKIETKREIKKKEAKEAKKAEKKETKKTEKKDTKKIETKRERKKKEPAKKKEPKAKTEKK